MTQILAGKVSIPDGVLVREMAGESVLLNLNSESYFGLDEVGTRMWAVLVDAPSVATAFDALSCEYDVDPEQLRVDLHSFVQKLIDLGLLDVRID